MLRIVDYISHLVRNKRKRPRTRTPDEITTIAIHHSLTIPNASPEAIANFHVNDPKHNWPCVGYPFMVDDEGTVFKTARISEVTYHVGDSNRSALGVCMIGNFDESRPTDAQWRSTVALCDVLVRSLPRVTDASAVKGHHEYPGYSWKSCPGKNVSMASLRTSVWDKIRGQVSASNLSESHDVLARAIVDDATWQMLREIAKVTLRQRLQAWFDRKVERIFDDVY